MFVCHDRLSTHPRPMLWPLSRLGTLLGIVLATGRLEEGNLNLVVIQAMVGYGQED